MAAEQHIIHTHRDPEIPGDELLIVNPIIEGDFPRLQIDQSDGITASIRYTKADAPVLAQAILEAAGLEASDL